MMCRLEIVLGVRWWFGTIVLLTPKSGSPLDTDLERISLACPRIKHLRDLFVIESGARSRSRTLSVLTACEYRSCLTQQRVGAATGDVLAGTRCYALPLLSMRGPCPPVRAAFFSLGRLGFTTWCRLSRPWDPCFSRAFPTRVPTARRG